MRPWLGVIVVLAVGFGAKDGASAEPKPLFDSRVVSTNTPGHVVSVDIDITGATELWLVVGDAGDGIGCDWADWIEPRLVGPDGEKRLTDLKWKEATAGHGAVQVNANAGGGLLRVDGNVVGNGLGTHAPSVIGFDIPKGFQRFRAKAGLDEAGTVQGCGSSVRFLVFAKKPTAPLASGGGATSPLHLIENAVAGLDVATGLEASVFAGEPMLLSPSDIDVDHRGRVWVCEVVNYRGRSGQRPEGDRILILEDTDQDGVADKKTVFYQGRDIDSALGICVLENKVIVSVAPNVFVLTDDDGDGKADRKEVLFSQVGQPQHDHSTHAFVFGPDGKLYWNVGNTGHAVHDRDGKPVVDLAGNVVNDSGKPYRQGMVFRCNLDGSEFETLAHNFRNIYEVAVDSFGTLWQSDNDDDGNKGVRINYVMPFGNYGYVDEVTGAGWQVPRTNMESEVSLRHWHLNDPGVVPNLLQTGQGSPTGICVYEGALLPEVFRNQIIHCDAGPNVVRAYPVKDQGAGYSAEVVNVLEGTRDRWFRPSDVCVAPDGSLIVADWYDPGVGGHGMGDIDKGRLFRLAPPGTKYVIPALDVTTVEGAIRGLRSPNQDTRYLAWTALRGFGEKAEAGLAKMFREDPNPRFRARALWLLSKLSKPKSSEYLSEAVAKGADPDLAVTAIRAGRELKPSWRFIANDVRGVAPKVLREMAIAGVGDAGFADSWAGLATAYDGQDRWYLEALGIGAAGNWDAFLAAYLRRVPEAATTKAGREIIWRSRAKATADLLAKIIEDSTTPTDELPHFFRAFDFLPAADKGAAIERLAFQEPVGDERRRTLVVSEAASRLQGGDLARQPERLEALRKVLDRTKGSSIYLALVDRFQQKDRYPELVRMATEQPDSSLAFDAVRVLFNRGQQDLVGAGLRSASASDSVALVRALGNSADQRSVPILAAIVDDRGAALGLRQEAAKGLGKTPMGSYALIGRIKEKKLATELTQAAAFALQAIPFNDPNLKREVDSLFPPAPARNEKPLPPLAVLLKSKGDAGRGKNWFNTVGKCNTCHVVNGEGKEVGPNLSEVGSKLSREAFFEAILFPSAGISHNYETWTVSTVDGNLVSGIKVSETPTEIVLRGSDAISRTFKKREVEEMKAQPISLMPADLQKTMTADELIDVVEYVQSLKKK